MSQSRIFGKEKLFLNQKLFSFQCIRCELGIVDASPNLQSSSKQHPRTGAHWRAREKLSTPNPCPFRIAKRSAASGRFRLFNLQAFVHDGLWTYCQNSPESTNPYILHATNVPLVARSQNQSLLQSGRQYRFQRYVAQVLGHEDNQSTAFLKNLLWTEGAQALMQLSGLGKMKPNMVLMGYKRDWNTCPEEELNAYFGVIQ